MRICIDASNISRGGGLTHLVQLLRHDLPDVDIEGVFVWASAATLASIEDRPWLTKRTEAALEGHFLRRALWQRNRLGELARQDGCDVLYVPGGSFATSFRPVVTMSRNLLPFELRELLRYGFSFLTFKFLALRWTQSTSLRAANGTIFLTRYARDAVTARIGALPGATALVPHGADARFKTKAGYRARRLEDCSPERPFRIVYVSIVDVYKHQDHLARAVSALRERGHPVRLDLIGPAYAPALARLNRVLRQVDPTGKAVHLAGPRRYEELPAVYADADLAVFASSCENMPNILLEMMAAGLPIACSKRGPMPEVLDDGEFFDPEDADDIAAVLERMMLSPALREQRASQASERAAQFSWQRCTTDTFQFLGTVVQQHRSKTKHPSKLTRGLAAARKVVRFVGIYGLARTWFKAAGRLGLSARLPRLRSATHDVGVIGCGQFAFATIGFFLRNQSHRLGSCFDIEPKAQDAFARSLGVAGTPRSIDDFLATPGLKTVYIASNHASHTPYALRTLAQGIDTYIEKPVAVTQAQLVDLVRAKRQSSARVFAGYNRPFSGAVQVLRRQMSIDPAKGITLQCFVSGHAIAADNWYRRPEEGSRVCGNVGHWLDLFVHMLSWRGMPDKMAISMTVADPEHPDDNVAIAISSDRSDLFSVMLSTRVEPFEGVNESINVQHNDTIAKIDDFRRMTIWQNERLIRRRFWPKDVGHQGAILQPFRGTPSRDWQEVVQSTQLMLHIADMLRAGVLHSTFSFRESAAQLAQETELA